MLYNVFNNNIKYSHPCMNVLENINIKVPTCMQRGQKTGYNKFVEEMVDRDYYLF